MIRRRSAALLLTCAALTLSLSACVPEDGGPTPSATTGTAAPSPTPSATPTDTPSPTTPPAAAGCVVGNWLMDQAALEAFYSDVNSAMAGQGASFSPQGTAALTLGEDGTFRWAPTVTLSVAASGPTIIVNVSGAIDGTYTASDTRITTANQSTAGLQIAASIDGTPVDAGSVTDMLATAPLNDASYTCSGDTLSLTSTVNGTSAVSVLRRN